METIKLRDEFIKLGQALKAAGAKTEPNSPAPTIR